MTRNGGRLLVECLARLGVSKSFGVPGESYLAVLDALHDFEGKLDYIICRQEGGAAYMAAAYGKLTGMPGICFVTRGPGAANAMIGVHTAMQDSSPMILFVGQVGTDMKEREAFQELDYKSVFGQVAKWVVEVNGSSRIPEIIARAWTTALSGRPGPVVVALPEDVLAENASAMPIKGKIGLSAPSPSANAMGKARGILSDARRPLIIYGGCLWTASASRALQKFAEASNIPVVSVFRYQDQFDNHSSVFCGEAGVGMIPSVKSLVANADAILALGNRFGENSTDGYTLLNVPEPRQRLIHVHASDREIGKVYLPELGIHADPCAFAESLSEAGPVTGTWDDWRANGRNAYLDEFILPDLPSPVDMGKVSAHLRKTLPDDVILTNGAGNFTVWPNRHFIFGPKARLLAPQSGAMGYGVPAAIAAKVAKPESTVVCFSGDGDFQMTCQELATAQQASAQPIILILNNGTYGTIRAHQERNYPARVFGTSMVNPDFVSLARAYGFHAERVENTEQFEEAFKNARGSKTGSVLDLNIAAEAITPRATISQLREAALKNGE
ncbi:MAG: thiamine pyrophosphate-binding protein [Roseovarius sp.]|nr:thiamine pyrophosphate-binding protein [Roseovarius sp.]MCY4207478.1 thiamine pyrophosphate-binding protein [Roseovarius sp.]MCY4290152.1 thiamine pyrophosphate-binding protein [Roseovarius sp.]